MEEKCKYTCSAKARRIKCLKERETSFWAQHSRYHTTSLFDSCLFLETVCRNGGVGRDAGKQQQKCKIQDCVLQCACCLLWLSPTEATYKTFINSEEQSCNRTAYFWKFDSYKKFNLKTARAVWVFNQTARENAHFSYCQSCFWRGTNALK